MWLTMASEVGRTTSGSSRSFPPPGPAPAPAATVRAEPLQLSKVQPRRSDTGHAVTCSWAEPACIGRPSIGTRSLGAFGEEPGGLLRLYVQLERVPPPYKAPPPPPPPLQERAHGSTQYADVTRGLGTTGANSCAQNLQELRQIYSSDWRRSRMIGTAKYHERGRDASVGRVRARGKGGRGTLGDQRQLGGESLHVLRLLLEEAQRDQLRPPAPAAPQRAAAAPVRRAAAHKRPLPHAEAAAQAGPPAYLQTDRAAAVDLNRQRSAQLLCA